uniref:Uncharacterized protein n=1 Tax=Anguilla anguilla TaxID=7936 RepID=A0A0E9TLK7_ANGAN
MLPNRLSGDIHSSGLVHNTYCSFGRLSCALCW